MASKIPIFITGATGYVGGAVLVRLLRHPKATTFDITTIVRSATKAKILQGKFGVNAVVGSFHEFDNLANLAEKAHIVFHIADADDDTIMSAILRGMKERHAKTGDAPILVQTSGTGTLIDDARGMYITETIYSDTDVEQLKSIPYEAFHRNVDSLVMEADQEGYIRGYIILPGLIYGIAKNELVDAGISNPYSMQVPILIRTALARGRSGVVGMGKAVWPNVHVDDTADLFIILLDALLSRPDAVGHGWEGWFFAENGEHTWYELSSSIGDALVSLGHGDNAEPTAFTQDELVQYFGSVLYGHYFGTNSRCRADRSRALGWQPKYSKEDMLASIKPEMAVWARLRAEGKLTGNEGKLDETHPGLARVKHRTG